MIIAIYNLEYEYTNIALEKIRMFHEIRGDHVEKYVALKHDQYDKIYCSSIFTWTDKTFVSPDMIIGGSGFDLTTKLPDHIEMMKPKINLGFTSRGCVRNCGFCIVPKKEGPFRPTGTIYDFWDGQSKELTILDNNILVHPTHFKWICRQIAAEDIVVDFNQGLDCRLMTAATYKILKTIRYKLIRFAFDHISQEAIVLKTIRNLKKYNLRRACWFILVGYNSTFQEDIYRCQLLRKHNQRVFIQRYNKTSDNPVLMALSRWGNMHSFFAKLTFKQFLSREENRFYLKTLLKKGVIKLEKPTKEQITNAKKQKKSLVAQLERMDIYSKFKVVTEIQGIKIRDGLREAVMDYLKKYSK